MGRKTTWEGRATESPRRSVDASPRSPVSARTSVCDAAPAAADIMLLLVGSPVKPLFLFCRASYGYECKDQTLRAHIPPIVHPLSRICVDLYNLRNLSFRACGPRNPYETKSERIGLAPILSPRVRIEQGFIAGRFATGILYHQDGRPITAAAQSSPQDFRLEWHRRCDKAVAVHASCAPAAATLCGEFCRGRGAGENGD